MKQTIVTDPGTLKKQAYLCLLKNRLVKYARSAYDYSAGGEEAVEQYKVTCYLIRKAKNLGELLRVAHDMNLDVPEVVKLVLYPLVDGINKEDLAGAPETW